MDLIRRFWREYKLEILIFCLCFGSRFFYSLLVQFRFGSHVFVSFADAEIFLREAKNLMLHGTMSLFPEPPYLPDGLRTPLYLGFLGVLTWLKVPFLGIVTIQNFLAGLAGVIVFRIGKIFSGKAWIGFLAAALYGLEPSSIYWSNLLMSDSLFAFFFIATVYFVSQNKFYLSTLVLGLATLTRPVGFYFFPIFLILFFWSWRKDSGNSFKISVQKTVLAGLLFLLIIFPWMIRNKINFDTWELSSAGWLNLYIFTMKEFALSKGVVLPMPVAPADYHPASYQDFFYNRDAFYNYEFKNVPFYKANTYNLISKYPWDYFKFHINASFRSLNNHDYQYLLDYVLLAKLPDFNTRLGGAMVRLGEIFWWLIYVFAAAALWFERRKSWGWLFGALIVLNSLLISYNGILPSGGRYNMPFSPLALILGICGAVASYKWVCARLTASTSGTRV